MEKVDRRSRLWSSVRELGFWGAVRDLFAQTLHRLPAPLHPIHPFDRRHRVDTSGLIYADGLVSGHAHDGQSAGYYATAPSLFQGALSLWRETLRESRYALSDYTLVDVGCGKGRVLMLASEYRFREVVGVELHPGLVRVARKNLQRWMRGPRPCRHISVVEADVLSYAFPSGPVVIYFFNSFEREMVQLWLERLEAVAATRSQPIDLIYVHPEFGHLVQRTHLIKILADQDLGFSAEDAGADAFGVETDRCTVYRIEGAISPGPMDK